MAGSLFERLTQGEAGRRLSEDESIRMHLIRLLTTRQGAVQALPDYGLPDLNDLTLSRSELITVSCSEVKRCIIQYEPRLTNVEVTPFTLEDGQFTMAFRIEAMKVDEHGAKRPWQMEVSIDGVKVSTR